MPFRYQDLHLAIKVLYLWLNLIEETQAGSISFLLKSTNFTISYIMHILVNHLSFFPQLVKNVVTLIAVPSAKMPKDWRTKRIEPTNHVVVNWIGQQSGMI